MVVSNTSMLAIYMPADRAAGGIHAEDRKGLSTSSRFVTMATGALYVLPGATHNSDDIGTVAAPARRHAK